MFGSVASPLAGEASSTSLASTHLAGVARSEGGVWAATEMVFLKFNATKSCSNSIFGFIVQCHKIL